MITPRSFLFTIALFGGSLFIALLTITGEPKAAERLALVIGNSAYAHTDPLTNPARDAQLIASALKNANFKVQLHVDLTQKKMKRAVRDFSRDLRRSGPNAVSLVYFAGHGTQVGGHNYLLPIDADIEAEQDVGIEALSLDDILKQMENSDSSLSIVVLDACRNNPYKRKHRASVRGLAVVKAIKSSLIAYSTAPGTVASDGDGANSPYATALDKFLRTKGLSIEKMFKNVRVEVDRLTNGAQTPWEESSLFGDFVFLPGNPQDASKRGTSSRDQSPRDTKLAAETAFWNTVKDSDNPAAIESYIRTFPKGLFTPLAQIKLVEQKAKRKKGLDLIKNKHVSSLVRAQKQRPRGHKPSPRPQASECLDFFRKDGTDSYCVSSRLASQQGNSYGVASLLDDSNYTAWFENKDQDGIGEWVLVDFGELRKVNEITIKNGYNKSEKLFYKNGAIGKMSVQFSGGQSQTLTLADEPGQQVFTIFGNVKAHWVQLKILSARQGRKYLDTGLNELRVHTTAVGK